MWSCFCRTVFYMRCHCLNDGSLLLKAFWFRRPRCRENSREALFRWTISKGIAGANLTTRRLPLSRESIDIFSVYLMGMELEHRRRLRTSVITIDWRNCHDSNFLNVIHTYMPSLDTNLRSDVFLFCSITHEGLMQLLQRLRWMTTKTTKIRCITLLKTLSFTFSISSTATRRNLR